MGQGHAVVVGASMAGLLTARVLADRFEQVTVVERDDLPEAAEQRKGVPQGRHAHGLLPSGENVIRSLFPGLVEELVAGGAQKVETTTGKWWQGGGCRIAAPAAPPATFFSRPFLEDAVRRRLTALPNVRIVKAAAQHLEAVDGHVRGLVIEDGDGVSTLRSDLVVDCSGRGSVAGRWLEALGFEAPTAMQVHVDMAYATRLYTRTPGRVNDGAFFVTISEPPVHKRFAVAFPIEGDRWIVTLAGCHGDRPPTDEDEHVAFARSLPTADVADLITEEKPLGPIVTHRLPSSQWRQFHALRRHPAGFVALGDSICSFNPVYGQGMSSAAQQAVALGRRLDDVGAASDRLPRAFYKAAKKVITNPWSIAAGGDFVFPETTGPKPPGTDFINRYVGRVIIAAQHDVAVSTALWNVQGLLAPPPSLMKPAMAVRVLRASRRGPVTPVEVGATALVPEGSIARG